MKKLLALASVLVLGGTLGAAALSFASALSFAPARSYATGRDPFAVAIGDLNGDAKPDLATANFQGGAVSVLMNRGDGSFQARWNYRTGGRPFSVAIGDLNGDGKPDLAIANGAVAVLLNGGDGSFQAKRDYATGPAIAVSVAIGDLNGDGKPDLVTANSCCGVGIPSTVSVLLNRGDGSFQPNLDYETDLGPVSVAIGDLNGDGAPDLATANDHGYSVSVLLNRGDGSFRPKRDYDGDRPRSVAVGDLNGDGKLDLATANWDTDSSHNDIASASVFLNRGDGNFRSTRLQNRRRASIGRDRRLERRRQAGPGDRERLRVREHRLGARQQGQRQLPVQARLSNWRGPCVGRDRRSERRRQGRLGDRELREHRLRAPQHAGPLHGAGRL